MYNDMFYANQLSNLWTEFLSDITSSQHYFLSLPVDVPKLKANQYVTAARVKWPHLIANIPGGPKKTRPLYIFPNI